MKVEARGEKREQARAGFFRFRFFALLSYTSLLTILTSLFLVVPGLALAADKPARKVTAFLVTAYDYAPAVAGDDTAIGKSLCAIRCNAFSTDYLNYSEAGGWRIVKTAEDELIRLDPKNPFLEGECLCTADRYEIIVNELSFPDVNVLGEKIVH